METKTTEFLEQVRTKQILSDRQRIYAHIKNHPGITMNDLSRATRILVQTSSARLSELMDMGIVEVIAKTKVIGMVKLTSDSMLQIQEDPEAVAKNVFERRKLKFKRSLKALLVFGEYIPDDVKISLNRLLK